MLTIEMTDLIYLGLPFLYTTVKYVEAVATVIIGNIAAR